MSTNKIQFFSQDVEVTLDHQEGVKKAIETLVEKEGSKTGYIVFIFCSDGYLKELNKKFLKHDYFTDVMAFGNNMGTNAEGEVYISIDRVIENASLFKVSVKEELYRVMIHGVLHLLGMEDDTKEKKQQMHHKEDCYLKDLFVPVNEDVKE